MIHIVTVPGAGYAQLTAERDYTLFQLWKVFDGNNSTAFVNQNEIPRKDWPDYVIEDNDEIFFTHSGHEKQIGGSDKELAKALLRALAIVDDNYLWRKEIIVYRQKWVVLRHFEEGEEHTWNASCQKHFELYAKEDVSNTFQEVIFVPQIINGKLVEAFIFGLRE